MKDCRGIVLFAIACQALGTCFCTLSFVWFLVSAASTATFEKQIRKQLISKASLFAEAQIT